MISSAQAGRAVGPWGPLPATAPLRGAEKEEEAANGRQMPGP